MGDSHLATFEKFGIALLLCLKWVIPEKVLAYIWHKKMAFFSRMYVILTQMCVFSGRREPTSAKENTE